MPLITGLHKEYRGNDYCFAFDAIGSSKYRHMIQIIEIKLHLMVEVESDVIMRFFTRTIFDMLKVLKTK